MRLFSLKAVVLGLFLAAGWRGAAAVDVVADNDEGAPVFTTTGSWIVSSATGYNGGTYRYASGGSGAVATWTPTLLFPGRYQVFAVFVRGSNRTTDAIYTVRHTEGQTVVHIDQRGTPDQYYLLDEVSLGAYIFEAGAAGSVSLTAANAGVHIADALIFRPLEDAPPIISDVARAPYYPAADQAVTVRARVVDDIALKSVQLYWSAQPSGTEDVADMFDDGLHGDGAAGDQIHAAMIPGFPAGERIEYTIQAVDSADHLTSSPAASYESGVSPTIHLVLNELLASNLRGALDPDFQEAADWIEIVNLGPDVADLGAFALSDKPSSPTLWRFPAEAFLAPGEYLVIWADEMNTVGQAMHANFKLSADGETLTLYDIRNQRIADQLYFGPQISDVSLARIPDQTGPWIQTEKPTPGGPNIYGKSGAPPVISAPSGIYSAPFAVEITAPGASEIRYTLDGSAPGPASPLYTDAVTISATRPLRARAWYPDLDPSPVASASYFFNPPADRTIPIIDIVMDPQDFDGPDGIYNNYSERGIEWERPAHVTVMSPDGAQVFEVETGVRMHGGYSRGLAKKSLRLYFRSAYGPDRWSLPWMTRSPIAGFQQLVLRSGANDSFLGGSTIRPVFYRDQLMRDWHGEIGLRSADGFFAALYINGAYWGLYNATERITDTYMEDTYGGADWDIVKGSWDSVRKYFIEAVDGDLAAWNEFIEWFESRDMATDADFQALRTRMDMSNFLNHFALNIICQNHDWPHNNWIATRRRNDPEARWTWHEWDAEWALGFNPTGWQNDTLTWARGNNYYLQRQFAMPPLSLIFDGNGLDPNAAAPINGILDHPQGRREFLSCVDNALNFELEPARAIAAADQYDALIRTEIPREAARWATAAGQSAATLISNYNTGVANVRAFLQNRPAYIRNLIATFFATGGSQTITFNAAGEGAGRLVINNHTVALPWTGTFFITSTVAIRPLPEIGSRFESWSGLVQSANPILDYTIAGAAPGQITVTFETAQEAPRPNDVIFNEYWLNDNSTAYATLEGRTLDGDWIELLTIRDGLDLRGWRVTNNKTLAEGGPDSTGGSLIFPDLPALQSVPAGTFLLLINKISAENTANFPADEFDPARRRMIFYSGNGNLDVTTDPGFSVPTGNTALVLLAPGATEAFADDIGIDFIAEGSEVTPASFGVSTHGVVFVNPFEGIGGDDGAVFQNSAGGGFVNDDGADPNRDDFVAGPGGWVVDPPKAFSGDDPGNPANANLLTPGARNTGQAPWPLVVITTTGWSVY